MIATLLFSALLTYSVHGQCQRSGYSLIGDLCYGISNQKLNIQDARNYCHGTSSNLAVIHTTVQANFLASNVRTQTGAPEGIFWIGLSRAAVGSRFTWDDGTNMFWSNFDPNFPQDNVFVAESTVNGKWRTLDGVQQLFFVCSYDPTNVYPVTTTGGTTQYTTAPGSSATWADSTSVGTTLPESTVSASSTGYPTTSFFSTNTASETPYPSSTNTALSQSTITTDYPTIGSTAGSTQTSAQ